MSCRRHFSIAACTTLSPCGLWLRSSRTLALPRVLLFAHLCDCLPSIRPCLARAKSSAWAHDHRRHGPQEASERRAEATMGLIELVLTVCALATPTNAKSSAFTLRQKCRSI